MNTNKIISIIDFNNKTNTMILIYEDEIFGIKFENNHNFSKLFNFKLDEIFSFYINNNFSEINEEFTIYGILFPYIISYSIINNQIQNNNNEINLETDKANFIKNIKKNISDIPLLISKNNNSEKIISIFLKLVQKKNYLIF